MKPLLVLLSLTFLASCTLMQEKTAPNPSSSTPSAVVPSDSMVKEDNSMMKKDEGAMINTNDTMMKKEDSMMKDDDAMMKKETGYQTYSPELVANALKSGQKVALFFHATWCPSCKSLDTTIKSTLSAIPDDTLIVKVDFDQYADLKKQYRVASQHTTVQLNADGTEKSRKLGARSVAQIFE